MLYAYRFNSMLLQIILNELFPSEKRAIQIACALLVMRASVFSHQNHFRLNLYSISMKKKKLKVQTLFRTTNKQTNFSLDLQFDWFARICEHRIHIVVSFLRNLFPFCCNFALFFGCFHFSILLPKYGRCSYWMLNKWCYFRSICMYVCGFSVFVRDEKGAKLLFGVSKWATIIEWDKIHLRNILHYWYEAVCGWK